ncbi:MAG TPA: hypothetical protein VIS99_02750 [Terrimicrobiaceae bacterium]
MSTESIGLKNCGQIFNGLSAQIRQGMAREVLRISLVMMGHWQKGDRAPGGTFIAMPDELDGLLRVTRNALQRVEVAGALIVFEDRINPSRGLLSCVSDKQRFEHKLYPARLVQQNREKLERWLEVLLSLPTTVDRLLDGSEYFDFPQAYQGFPEVLFDLRLAFNSANQLPECPLILFVKLAKIEFLCEHGLLAKLDGPLGVLKYKNELCNERIEVSFCFGSLHPRPFSIARPACTTRNPDSSSRTPTATQDMTIRNTAPIAATVNWRPAIGGSHAPQRPSLFGLIHGYSPHE